MKVGYIIRITTKDEHGFFVDKYFESVFIGSDGIVHAVFCEDPLTAAKYVVKPDDSKKSVLTLVRNVVKGASAIDVMELTYNLEKTK